MADQPNLEHAAFVDKEKRAKQRYDRALQAFKAMRGDAPPHDISMELELAKREWEAVNKKIEALRAEGARK